MARLRQSLTSAGRLPAWGAALWILLLLSACSTVPTPAERPARTQDLPVVVLEDRTPVGTALTQVEIEREGGGRRIVMTASMGMAAGAGFGYGACSGDPRADKTKCAPFALALGVVSSLVAGVVGGFLWVISGPPESARTSLRQRTEEVRVLKDWNAELRRQLVLKAPRYGLRLIERSQLGTVSLASSTLQIEARVPGLAWGLGNLQVSATAQGDYVIRPFDANAARQTGPVRRIEAEMGVVDLAKWLDRSNGFMENRLSEAIQRTADDILSRVALQTTNLTAVAANGRN